MRDVARGTWSVFRGRAEGEGLREQLSQDAAAGRGKPRPYKRNEEGRASCLPFFVFGCELVRDSEGGGEF